jgi:hypothetical protein
MARSPHPRTNQAETMKGRNPVQRLLRLRPDETDKLGVLALQSIAADTGYTDEQRETANKKALECLSRRAKSIAYLRKCSACFFIGGVLLMCLSQSPMLANHEVVEPMLPTGLVLVLISLAALYDASMIPVPMWKPCGPDWAGLWVDRFRQEKTAERHERAGEQVYGRINEIERSVKEYR